MKKALPHILFAVILLIALLPAAQMRWSLIEEKPLNGAFELAEKPVLSYENWMSGDFQMQTEKYLKDHSGFRNFLIRLQNQLDFTLFKQANAEGATVGKKGQLFEYDYIRSWLALDYPGDSFLEKKLQRARFVQDYLKREKGIDLVVVFEPGKASYYPEYLPSSYKKQKKGPSTYDYFVKKAKETGIDYIDLQQYFLELKDTSRYPLFPAYGTHWSVYGMKFAADSLLRLIGKRRNLDLTDVRLTGIETSTLPRDTDDDVLKTMNLLCPMQGEELAYPLLAFDTLNPGEKPMVLVVADSYYWNIFNTRIPKYIFANEAFWYFNALVYPDHYNRPTFTKDLDLKAEIEKQDIIFLMITERFVHKFDWRFTDQLYELYAPQGLSDPVYDKINNIMTVEEWFEKMITKAGYKHATLEEILIDEGKYLYHMSDTAGFMIRYGEEYFRKMISGDRKWMGHIEEKAARRGIPVEDMLVEDALFVFKEKHPELYKLNRSLESVRKHILANPDTLALLREEARNYHFDPDLYLQHRAWEIVHRDEVAKTERAIRQYAPWLEDVARKALENGISVDEMIRLDAEYMWKERLRSVGFKEK
ncbi:MAG: hypothetical protein KBC43_12390 [Bacteroidales bacterium]|nr:hypothetical protein [Bacteroidales bacterium]